MRNAFELFMFGRVAQKQPPEGALRKKGVLKIFTKFTGKHLSQSLLFNKVAGMRPATLALVFSYEFWKTLKKTYFEEDL